MKLKQFKVTNYRSFCSEAIIDFDNYTVLISKNNQGKTNALKAIKTAIGIIASYGSFLGYSENEEDEYEWEKDFPRNARSSKKNRAFFELSFELSEKGSRGV